MMKKRLLSSFLCLCMALTLLPATAWASSDILTPHTHAVGVDTAQGAPVTFTALGSATTLARGQYFLEADKELTTALTIPADTKVDLCLNGHALKYVGEDKSSVIKIAPGGTLNICDCDGDGGSHTVIDPTTEKEVTIEGGLITGGTGMPGSYAYMSYGGGVYMGGSGLSDAPATLRLYGGSIAGNTTYDGGGIYLNPKDTLELHGGQVAYNTATDNGGGIYLYDGTLTMGGNSRVAYNKGGGVYQGTITMASNAAITGNLSRQSGTGGVDISGSRCSLTMSDNASITSNHAISTTTTSTGGVWTSNGTLTVSGGARIWDNTQGKDAVPADVLIGTSGSEVHVLTIGGALTAEAKFGVRLGGSDIQQRVFTTGGGQAYFDHFVCQHPWRHLLAKEGELYLEPNAFTQQPTAEEPTVAVNYAPQGIQYQWYPAITTPKTLTTDNDSDTNIKASICESMMGDGHSSCSGGVWTASTGDINARYFDIPDLKTGDVVTVTLLTEAPEGSKLQLLCGSEWVICPTETGKLVYTLLATADRQSSSLVITLPDYDSPAPQITATLTRTTLGAAVSGQTTKTLDTTSLAAGDYLCRVTWPDGTYLDSDIVTHTPPTPPHKHAVSVDCATTGENLVTFQALTSQNGALYIDGAAAEVDTLNSGSYLLPPGSYYLAGDVALDKMLELSGESGEQTVDLCLNGHKLEYMGTEDVGVIWVGWVTYALNICDCDPDGGPHTIQSPVIGEAVTISGGLITGGKASGISHKMGEKPVTLYGGTIAGNGAGTGTVYGGGVGADHFVMRGGAIVHNKAYWGGGANASKSFTMSGGVIRHNWATGKGGGVSTSISSNVPTAVTLSGSAVITDNVAGENKAPSNLHLVRNCTAKVTGLGQSAGVGVTTATAPTASQSVTVATPPSGSTLTADDLAKFTSDSSDYELKLDGGNIVLAVPHVHNWVTTLWSSNETSHWHACNAVGCPVTDNSQKNGYGAHDFDDDYDPDCNTCGYIRDVPKRDQTAPSRNLFTVTDANEGQNNGSIAISADVGKLEYRLKPTDGNETAYAAAAAALQSLAPGWYQFRYKETDTHNASPVTEVEVRALKPTAKKLSIQADIQHGSVTAVRQEVNPEDTVKLTVTPDAGYQLATLAASYGENQSLTPQWNEATGTYNFTMPNADVTVTATFTAIPPEDGETKGEVEVGPGTPEVSVDEKSLKDLAGQVQPGQTVTVKLTVKKQEAPADKTELESVISGQKDDVLYLDLALVKQVNDLDPEHITDTLDKVLEIAVPYDFTGKKDVTVYRKHGDTQAEALTELAAQPNRDLQDGTFYADSAGGKVYIYASKFSTYAIGYTAESKPVTPSGGSSVGGYVPPTVIYSPKDKAELPFTDVKTTDAFYEAVKYVFENKLMVGTSETTFEPQGELTRAMLATILYRAAGSPKMEGAPEFEDTLADAWYSDAIVWAAQTQVLRGYGNGKFGPEDPVSREMMQMVAARQAGQDPAWVGDPELSVPATRAEIAQTLLAQTKK